MSSVLALKVNPNKETVFPSKVFPSLKLMTLSANEFFLVMLDSTDAFIIFKSRPNFFPILDKAIESFGKQEPPIPGPGLKKEERFFYPFPLLLQYLKH